MSKSVSIVVLVMLPILLSSGLGQDTSSKPSAGHSGNFAAFFDQHKQLVGVQINSIAPGYGTLDIPLSDNERQTGFPGSIDPSYDPLSWQSDSSDVFDLLLDEYKDVNWLVYCGNGIGEDEKERVSQLGLRLAKLKKLKSIKLTETNIDGKLLSSLLNSMAIEYLSIENCQIDGLFIKSGSLLLTKQRDTDLPSAGKRHTDFQVRQ
ncbi:MAG: hypothetical protein U0795_00465 [Pirellulales bacterium]